MASLPAYLASDHIRKDASGLTMTVRLRIWHPAFWPELWKLLPGPLWQRPALWLWAMGRLAWRQA